MAELLESLGVNQVVYLEGKSPKDIQLQLNQIHLPFGVLGAYGLNGKHYLVIETDANKIKIKRGDK